MENKHKPPFKAINKQSLRSGNIFELNDQDIPLEEYPLTINYEYRTGYIPTKISFELKNNERSKSRCILYN